MEFYNYQEIRTPIFESTELFARGVGGSTDVVQKEMYTFIDKGDRSMTLRPEGTAAVVRSYIENKMQGLPNQPVKLYYNGPMFRYESKRDVIANSHNSGLKQLVLKILQWMLKCWQW